MKSNNLFLFLLLLFCSCNFRLYTDGKFDHKAKGLTSKWKTTNDSCIMLGKDDKIPDGAILINNTEIKSPFVWLTMASPPEVIVNELKTDAQKKGANIIQIEGQHGNKFTRLGVNAKMYSLKEPFLTKYKKLKDSVADYKQRNFCILHIRNNWTFGKVEVYFNDSLIGTLPKWKWSKKDNSEILNFTTDHSGVLWLKAENQGHGHKMEIVNVPYSKNRADFDMIMGNEYFVRIDFQKGRSIFSSIKNIEETGWYIW